MYNTTVFVSHFQKLVLRKSAQVGRRLSLRDIAEDSRISLATIQKANAGKMDQISMPTVAALCTYFKLKRITDLVEWVPDPDTEDE